MKLSEITLTENEKTIIETLEDNRDWLPSADVADLAGFKHIDLSENQIKGVLGSLQKKGLVESYKVNGNGPEVSNCTRSGSKYYEKYLKDEDEKIEVDLGNYEDIDQANRVKDILQGDTFYNFNVIVAKQGPNVKITVVAHNTKNATEKDVREMVIYCLARQL